MRTINFLFLITLVSIILFSCTKNEKNDMELDKSNDVLNQITNDPTISFNIWFKVGSQDDLAGKEGLANITASLISSGSTINNKYADIIAKLYPIAAGYGASVDKEMTSVGGRIHKDNLDEYYSLFIDAILNPAFSQDDFDRIKKNTLSEIEKTLRYSSDEELGKATLYGAIFTNTPYGHIVSGTIAGINSVTIDDVKEFHKKYYNKNNFVIGLAGGFDDALLTKLHSDLNKLPEGSENKGKNINPTKINGLNFTLVEKDKSPKDITKTSTAISFGFPISILRADDDFVALDVFRSWFGEHRNQSSHLYKVIREERGMNYGDYAYIEAFNNGGRLSMPNPNNARKNQIFEVWIRPVEHANRHFALRAALRELQLVVDNGLTNEAFESTKQFLNKYSLHYAPTVSKRLGYQIDSKFYGVNDNGNYIDYYRNKLNSLTLEDVNEAIKKYIQYNNIEIAMISYDCEQLKEDLISNTVSPIKYKSDKEKHIYDEDKIISTYNLDIDPDNITIIPVEEMFEK